MHVKNKPEMVSYPLYQDSNRLKIQGVQFKNQGLPGLLSLHHVIETAYFTIAFILKSGLILTSLTISDTSSMAPCVHLISSYLTEFNPAFSQSCICSSQMQLWEVWCHHLTGDTERFTLITNTAWRIAF